MARHYGIQSLIVKVKISKVLRQRNILMFWGEKCTEVKLSTFSCTRNAPKTRLLTVPFWIIEEQGPDREGARNSQAKKPKVRAIDSAARLERGEKNEKFSAFRIRSAISRALSTIQKGTASSLS